MCCSKRTSHAERSVYWGHIELGREGVTGMPFHTIEEAINDIRQGKMVILVDDEERENEGDLTMAADKVTPGAINFMTRYGRGLICLSLTAERLAAMRRKGFEPAVVVEPKPGVYQAWVALSARPVVDQVRQLAAEGLARGFGAASPAHRPACASTARGKARLPSLYPW